MWNGQSEILLPRNSSRKVYPLFAWNLHVHSGSAGRFPTKQIIRLVAGLRLKKIVRKQSQNSYHIS